MSIVEQCLELYERTGCLERVAEKVGWPATKIRNQMQRFLKKRGMDYEHLSPHLQTKLIDKHTEKPLSKFMEHYQAQCGRPVAACRVGDKIKFVAINKIEGDLIGVYNSDSKANDRREDLYWYIKNYMEAQQ